MNREPTLQRIKEVAKRDWEETPLNLILMHGLPIRQVRKLQVLGVVVPRIPEIVDESGRRVQS